MKKLIFLSLSIFTFAAAFAQSAEEGRKHFYYERFNTSARVFESLLKSQPQAEYLYWVTEALAAQNNTAAAQKILEEQKQFAGQPYYNIAFARILLDKGKKDSAALYFQHALDQTNEKDEMVLAAIANAHTRSPNGDPAFAVSLLEKSLKRDKKNAAFLLYLGNAYKKAHNGNEAYKAYSAALEKDASLAEAHYQLGRIFQTQKNTEVYLDHFTKAIAADAGYAPAYYQLYKHYLYTEPGQAMNYFEKFRPLSDDNVRNEYAFTDLLYLTRKYADAIVHAQNLVKLEGDRIQPRIYKLLAYSQQGLADTTSAIVNMRKYFAFEHDSNLVAKDFETMGDLLLTVEGKEDSAMLYYSRMVPLVKDPSSLPAFYKKLAAISKTVKNYAREAEWLEKYYHSAKQTTNVDLFNWGVASYQAGNYIMADSVFAMYSAKYPDQAYGYYWRAKSNAGIDTAMNQGLAVPHYQELIRVLSADSTKQSGTFKRWMVEAYGYLAAYETNTNKDYPEAIEYFEKLLEIDPGNEDAKKYVAILEETIEKGANR